MIIFVNFETLAPNKIYLINRRLLDKSKCIGSIEMYWINRVVLSKSRFVDKYAAKPLLGGSGGRA